MFSHSDGYERFMGRWSRRLAPLLVEFARVGEGNVVLDIGCGTGALTLAAATIPSVRVTGIDPSSAFIQSAQLDDRGERVRFEVGDASALRFRDATFDRAVSLLVLNFLPDPATAVKEMIRVTRPGGIVAAAVWDYGEGMQMLRAFWDAAVESDPAVDRLDERHMPLTTRDALSDLWRSHGLQNVEAQSLTIEMPFASFDDYWQPFLCGQGPAGVYAASLPEPARQALQSGLRDRLVHGDPDVGFTLRARAWAVRGLVI